MLKLSATATATATANTRTIELPTELADQLQAEARRSRKSVVGYVRELIEDQVDGREAAKVMKRIKDGKEKAHPADEVYARLGI